jgi:hypothetical protein
LLRAATATVASHPSLGSWLALCASRLLHTFHWREVPNNVNYYFYLPYAAILRLLPVSFGMLAPPALAGLAFGLGRRRRAAALYLLVAASLPVTVLLFTFGRFRLALAAALFPFAGHAVAVLLRELAGRRGARAGTIAALVLAPAVLTLRPLPPEVSLVLPDDLVSAIEVDYGPRMQRALAAQDPRGAIAVMEEAMAHAPAEIRELGPSRPALAPALAELARLYSGALEREADLADQVGDAALAARARARAAELRDAAGGHTR